MTRRELRKEAYKRIIKERNSHQEVFAEIFKGCTDFRNCHF